MKSAAKLTVSTFGILAAVAGLEHGMGEILQGNRPPEGIMFLSWPDSPFFQILSGEPAMSLIPNLLVSGILAVLISLVFLWWVTTQLHRKFAGWVLIGLSVLWLLVGGGFGPPILGLILGVAVLLNPAVERGKTHKVSGVRRFLSRLWPWVYAGGLIAWLLLFPGLNLLDYSLQLSLSDAVVYGVILSSFLFLLLAIWTGAVRDRAQRAIPRRR
ncbi:MAG TPA: hypothetical protein VFF68_10625 [Anaerolineaceae bacterium]|nr:hypothetical protein [Anaerolineaceae bacterium]